MCCTSSFVVPLTAGGAAYTLQAAAEVPYSF
jgi:hypothetical protein